MSRWKSLLMVASLMAAQLPDARGAAPMAVTDLTVVPKQITLIGARDEKRIVVQARLSDGSTRDVTSVSQISIGKGSRLRHRYQDATVRQGCHRSPISRAWSLLTRTPPL